MSAYFSVHNVTRKPVFVDGGVIPPQTELKLTEISISVALAAEQGWLVITDLSALSAEQAIEARDIAVAQAGVATSAAGTATTQAGVSTAGANTATTQAGIATTAANTASNAAGAASSSAGTATTQAGIATTGANTATTQAGIATTAANTATTQAGIATTQAGIATTQANQAAASANLLGSAQTVLATDTVALLSSSAVYQFINPNGANRTVSLPDLTVADDGRPFCIKNTGTANTLEVRNAANVLMSGLAVTSGFSLTVVWTGTAWEVI